jgi:hypothetical protein
VVERHVPAEPFNQRVILQPVTAAPPQFLELFQFATRINEIVEPTQVVQDKDAALDPLLQAEDPLRYAIKPHYLVAIRIVLTDLIAVPDQLLAVVGQAQFAIKLLNLVQTTLL